MASLDEISFTLGQLTNSVRRLESLAERHDEKTDLIENSVREIKQAVQPLAEQVKDMVPHVDHYKKVRRFGASIAAGVLAIAGAAGGAASNYFFKKLGG
jgi:uncharacterized protein YoxC